MWPVSEGALCAVVNVTRNGQVDSCLLPAMPQGEGQQACNRLMVQDEALFSAVQTCKVSQCVQHLYVPEKHINHLGLCLVQV
jgi:hypothetical protein